MLSCSLLLAAYECGNTSAAAAYDDVSLTLYHPGSSDGLFALCLCLSVCFCVLAITTQVQMLRASLSEMSGLFQIYKLFILIYQTCVVLRYSVYIIVSDCLLFITIFDDLDLYFKLKHHYPSWARPPIPRGTSTNRHHHCKCCIMIMIMK